MKLDYNLELEQSQRLVITPELKIAIALLQTSALELKDYLEDELLNNPVLEVLETPEEKMEAAPAEELMDSLLYAKDQPWEDQIFETDVFRYNQRADYIDINTQKTIFKDYSSSPSGSLYDDLLAQLRMLTLEPNLNRMAAFLVGSLDDNGYLQGDIEDLSKTIGSSVGELKKALSIIQKLEPAGVGCRNLQECLLLQVDRDESYPDLCRDVIRHFLPAAADGRYSFISSQLGCDEISVKNSVELIRKLNPKPGSMYHQSNETRYIVPDVIVEKVDSDYIVITNESVIPQIKINPTYKKMLNNDGLKSDLELSSFIKNKLEKAYWLVRSLEQRRLTLLRVSQQIVDIQKPFLDYGVKMLKPLTLKEVAIEVGVHESTVSRATATKYIQTPRGLFPMKYFFSSGLSGSSGQDLSSHGIKKYIEEFIAAENPSKPYSDYKLAEKLKDMGITISRRTVAKYREEMAMQPSYKRHRQ